MTVDKSGGCIAGYLFDAYLDSVPFAQRLLYQFMVVLQQAVV